MTHRPPFEGWRVAQLLVDRADGRAPSRGSGYLVATGKVLTAAHVLAGATAVRVRLDVGRPTEIAVDSSEWWADPAGHLGTDLGVVEIAPEATAGRQIEPAGFGRFSESAAVLAVQAAGFPLFKLRGTDRQFRDLEQVRGHSPLSANRRQGTLAINLDDPPPPAGDPSPWTGMSGAAVWADGSIVGVITEHHPVEGPGRLTAQRIDQAYDELSPPDLATFTSLLGLPPYAESLPDMVPLTWSRVTELAYFRQVEDIAPEDLIGREPELAEWAEFCAGPEPYVWWQAGPWAGKSALASWFVTHPPAGVDVVSFFVTGRLAGQADSGAFLTAMIEQLEALVQSGDQPPPPASAARAGRWLNLLSAAAARSAERGRRLVVVVDGLDEDDVGAVPTRGRPSIAGLLPRHPPAGVRFIVTSRPDPGLPDDVPADHPLQTQEVRRLPRSAVAADVAVEAQRELRDLLTLDSSSIDVVGLIAASGGGLTRSDLLSLTGHPPYRLEGFLFGVSGRSLQRREEYGMAFLGPDREEVFLFGHETLRELAEKELGDDLLGYQEKIHTWMESWAVRGWPEGTPNYAARGYVRLLDATGDLRRLRSLARDPRRHDFLLRTTGNDSTALGEIRSAASLEADQSHPDLQLLTELAVHRHAISIRNQFIPPELPLLWARLDYFQHAEALTQTMIDRRTRESAVADLVRIALGADDIDRAERLTRTIETAGVRDELLADLAKACNGFEQDRADAFAAAIADPGERLMLGTDLVQGLLVWGGFDRAERLIHVLVAGPKASASKSHTITTGSGRTTSYVGSTEVYLLAKLAAGLAKAGEHQRARRVAAEAEAAARAVPAEDPDGALNGLVELAGLLGDFDWAERLANQIGSPDAQRRLIVGAARWGEFERADRYLQLQGLPASRFPLSEETIAAMAAAGELDRAEVLVEQIPFERPWDVTDSVITAAIAVGDLARAERLISPRSDPVVRMALFTALAAAAATVDELEKAVALARGIDDTRRQAIALTIAAVAAGEADARAGLGAGVGVCRGKAEYLLRQIPDPQHQGTAASKVAAAVARAGNANHAEAIIRSVTPDDRVQARAWTELAEVFLEQGELDRAHRLATAADRLGPESGRLTHSRALGVLAAISTRTQAYDEAEAIADRMPDSTARVAVLTDLAAAVAAAGDSHRAEGLVARLADRDDFGRAFGVLAAVKAWQGRTKPAVAYALEAGLARTEAITDGTRTDRIWQETFTDIVLSVAARDLVQAEHFARAVAEPTRRCRLLCLVAELAREAGDTDHAWNLAIEAEGVARSITDPAGQAVALATLAETTALAGDAAQAERLVGLIGDPEERDAALTSLIGRLAWAGSLNHAQDLARGLDGPVALRDVALAAARAGDHDRAAVLITEAVTMARELPEYLDAMLATQSVVHSLAGEFEAARVVADSVGDRRRRVLAWGTLSSHLAMAGQLDQAVELLAHLDDREARTPAVHHLIEATVRAGDIAKATTIAEQLPDDYDRARALNNLAAEVVRTGNTTLARTFITTTQAQVAGFGEGTSRDRVLHDLAVTSVELADDRLLKELLDAISSPELRARALAAVAVAVSRLRATDPRHPPAAGPRRPTLTDLREARQAGDADRLLAADQLLDEAEELARSIEHPDSQGVVLAALATAAADLGDPDRARRLLAAALSLDTSRINQWLPTIAKLFPEVIRACGPVFASVYSPTPSRDVGARS